MKKFPLEKVPVPGIEKYAVYQLVKFDLGSEKLNSGDLLAQEVMSRSGCYTGN